MATQFEKAVSRLLSTEPYYAHFLLNCKVIWDKQGIPTAAATVMNGVPTFIFNTEFLKDKSVGFVSGLIKHEVLHMLMLHLNNYKKLGQAEMRNYNIAMDCVINQYIPEISELEGVVTLESLSKSLKKDLLPWMTTDYYYEEIKQAIKDGRAKAQSIPSTADEHLDQEGSGEGGSKELDKAAIDAVAEKAGKQSAGNLPKPASDYLASIVKPSISWKTLLRSFVMTRIDTKVRYSRKRSNRRFELDAPGKIKRRTMTLGVCVDTSGSISDDEYTKFMGEIREISKHLTNVYLIEADTEISKVQDLKKKPKIDMKRSSSGGTAYGPAIDKAKNLGCTAIIYFGDMDAFDKPSDPRVPFLWVTVRGGKPPADFGRVIEIK